MAKVFTNGCFDLLHVGHVSLLKYCHELSGPFGEVIVGVNDDFSVTMLKGLHRPIVPQEQRVYMIESLRCVDGVYLFSEPTPYKLIKRLKPDIIVKGPDYLGKENEVVGADLAYVNIFTGSEDDRGFDRQSTTNIIVDAGLAYIEEHGIIRS